MNKKILALIIAIIVIVVLVGLYFILGNSTNTNESSVNKDSEQLSQTETSTNNNEVENKSEETENSEERNTLILYFSETGNTEKFANIIHNQIGGDIVKIEPTTPYPTEYEELANYARQERDNDERPDIENLDKINIDDYDTIFIGYPIWWYQMPMIMYSLFDIYDFSGKTIIPFNTHEGSGEGRTYDDIQELEPNANVLEGLPIRGGDMEEDQTSRISSWLDELGF